MENIDSFQIFGIQTETTDENGRSTKDIGGLWEEFYAESIPNRIRDEIYSIYTDCESDHTGKCTCVIGMKVGSLDNIPDGLVGRELENGKYQKFLAKGHRPNAVLETWQRI